MSVLIISPLCEHSKCASWAYEFVPVTFGKCLFLLSCFGLSLPCALCGLQQPVGLDSGGMDPSWIHLSQSSGEAALGRCAGAYLKH